MGAISLGSRSQGSPPRWDLASAATAAREFLGAFRIRLKDRRFWVVQAMVIGVAGSHAVSELFQLLPGEEMGAVYFVPATLYFFPVLYASLNFGREGAVPTAIWCALLATPNIILWHHGLQRAGEAFQLTSIVLFATIVATRVDREIAARRQAEERGQALRVSELRYRSLFDSAGEAIIVFDKAGMIHEANAASAALLSRPLAELQGTPLQSVLGPVGAASMLGAAGGESKGVTDFKIGPEERERWLEPVCTSIPGSDGALFLGFFRDVTARRGFQSYAREIVRAQEDERQRIARELHDVSLQSIVLLCRRLDAVEDAVGDELPNRASGALAEARVIAESIGAELRRFSRDLRPSILDDLGLVPAIRNLVSDLATASNVIGRFQLTGTPFRLAPNAEVSLFRIAQEGLRNVERHAQASRVTVGLAFGDDGVVLRITDNGRGFQVPALATNLASAGRLGLLGMQERASLTGGTCEISSRPGSGTRVIVHLPALPHIALTRANSRKASIAPRSDSDLPGLKPP